MWNRINNFCNIKILSKAYLSKFWPKNLKMDRQMKILS